MGRSGGKELLSRPFSKNFSQGLVNFNIKVQTTIYGIVHPRYKEALKLRCFGVLCQMTGKVGNRKGVIDFFRAPAGERDREFVNTAKTVTCLGRKGMEPLQGFNPTPSDSVEETFTNVLRESACHASTGDQPVTTFDGEHVPNRTRSLIK